MRVLIVHNQLWAHYKSKLFSDIFKVFKKQEPGSQFLVAQIGLYEASRAVMQNDEKVTYDYPYQLLFNKSLDQITKAERRAALFQVFKEFKPDVLNVTGWGDMAQVELMFYAKWKGVKVVISSESSAQDHARSSWKEAFKSFIINRGNAFFCFGKTSADYLENLGINPGKIPVRNAAVVDDQIIRENYVQAKTELKNANTARNELRRFVYVGRLAPEKNLEMLVQAFAEIQKAGNAVSIWELLLVGDGPARSSLEILTKKLGVEAQVTFAGGFPWYEVPRWLAQSDVLVLPSKSEPWGLVVNEAMVCGMPVIVSNKCGCAPDLVSNAENGFTFDPTAQTELEQAMLFFVKNPEKIAAMGAVSLEKIKPFSSGKVAEEMVKTYKILAKA
ncbi:glycosyltransferase [Dyadobacter sp. Leaf189]|uniref:glycosyltransferase n=1 Tax=Dyadobacter sp. Leaf189 TaxID=1736295 RepID=UPI0006F5D277|nr:glycosyltransferase [Dyadobacter sp. Leaf189]KQS26892.1 group 1 glycosyl transferase [Dyadobacter sp. Leaf189]